MLQISYKISKRKIPSPAPHAIPPVWTRSEWGGVSCGWVPGALLACAGPGAEPQWAIGGKVFARQFSKYSSLSQEKLKKILQKLNPRDTWYSHTARCHCYCRGGIFVYNFGLPRSFKMIVSWLLSGCPISSMFWSFTRKLSILDFNTTMKLRKCVNNAIIRLKGQNADFLIKFLWRPRLTSIMSPQGHFLFH